MPSMSFPALRPRALLSDACVRTLELRFVVMMDAIIRTESIQGKLSRGRSRLEPPGVISRWNHKSTRAGFEIDDLSTPTPRTDPRNSRARLDHRRQCT